MRTASRCAKPGATTARETSSGPSNPPVQSTERTSWPVYVDASTCERGAELVESSKAGFGVGLIGARDREDQRFDDDECRGVAGEEAGCAATALERYVDVVFEFAPERVGDQYDGHLEGGGVLEQDAHVGLESSVGEHDERVGGRECEELVGEGCPGVDERAAGLADPL